MTSNTSPSDREYDPAEALSPRFFGDDSDGHYFDELSTESPDHWIEEALRTVPLPDGFLTRMSLLAQSLHPDASSANSA